MERRSTWDLIAIVLVAAIAVPYIGYLMTATGLVLGLAAFVAAAASIRPRRLTRTELNLAAIALILGAVAFGLTEMLAAEVVLAVFMGAILVTALALAANQHGMKVPFHHGHRVAH
jgi:hypothetical protein